MVKEQIHLLPDQIIIQEKVSRVESLSLVIRGRSVEINSLDFHFYGRLIMINIADQFTLIIAIVIFSPNLKLISKKGLILWHSNVRYF